MNTIKTFFLMMVMTALLLLAGAAIGGEGGIVIALIFAVIMNFGAYWFSGRSMAKLFSTHPPVDERVRRLREMRSNF